MNKLILVTNDDSIHSKGIKELVSVARLYGRVVVVAPDKPQSAMGHAITISNPLRIHEFSGFDGVEAYECSGTPVDCVKLAIFEIMKRKPDLLLSGINHGENSSTNVLYSGTMSAAIEGAMEGIDSIGFSLSDFNPDADFTAVKSIAQRIIPEIIKSGLPENTCLNVNVPKLPLTEIKGIQVCCQAHAYWADYFDSREDQFGRPYYWLTGDFADVDQRKDTDLYALKNGYVSVVPTHFDLTNHKAMETIKFLEDERDCK